MDFWIGHCVQFVASGVWLMCYYEPAPAITGARRRNSRVTFCPHVMCAFHQQGVKNAASSSRLVTLAVFKTVHYASSTYWCGQKVVWRMLYVSKICSVSKNSQMYPDSRQEMAHTFVYGEQAGRIRHWWQQRRTPPQQNMITWPVLSSRSPKQLHRL